MVKNGQFCGGSCNNLKIGRPVRPETFYLSIVDPFKFVHEGRERKLTIRRTQILKFGEIAIFCNFAKTINEAIV